MVFMLATPDWDSFMRTHHEDGLTPEEVVHHLPQLAVDLHRAANPEGALHHTTPQNTTLAKHWPWPG